MPYFTICAIEIFSSEEDKDFITIIPELPGCSAFGVMQEQASREVKIARQLWLETAKKYQSSKAKPPSQF